jgi:hypothetical protein
MLLLTVTIFESNDAKSWEVSFFSYVFALLFVLLFIARPIVYIFSRRIQGLMNKKSKDDLVVPTAAHFLPDRAMSMQFPSSPIYYTTTIVTTSPTRIS